jgi:hypothetical protein
MLEIIIINNTKNLPRPVLGVSLDFFRALERIFPFFCAWTMCQCLTLLQVL